MKVQILGSGTSSGVPVIACSCAVCTSSDPKNYRKRSSIFVSLSEEEVGSKTAPRHILIDAGPDFRVQALEYKIPQIDAILFTHSHADHIFGLDDVRIFNFIQKSKIPVYADASTSDALLRIFNYCFHADQEYEGGGVPKLTLETITPGMNIMFGEFKVEVLKAFHGKMPVLGFKFGSFAYLTDCSEIPDDSSETLRGIPCLVLDGLRHRPHRTHLTISKAKDFALKQGVKKTYLTHLSHEIDHEPDNLKLRMDSDNKVELAYDGLIINATE